MGRGRLGVALVLGVAVLAGFLYGLAFSFVRHAPRLSAVTFRPEVATILYDREGREFARVFRENRTVIPITQMPKHLQQAVVAIEDARFYRHHGIDFEALGRALVRNLLHFRILEGGSTITAQLAKNAFLTHDRTITRKLQEVVWAIQIERKYSKEEILEAYLNEIYFGEGVYGIEAAAQKYFGKHASQLTLAESALLAGLIRNPTYYSPFRNLQASRDRRNFVLEVMVRQGYITREEADSAKQEPIRLRRQGPAPAKVAPYFVDYVVQYLRQKYGDEKVYTSGLRVYTTLDVRLQNLAVQALQNGLKGIPRRVDKNGLHQPQAALVAIDPGTGAILAMVGGTDNDKFNRATQALRQPGSAIKPFIYLAALQKGYSPRSVIVDEEVSYPGANGSRWTPENYDGRYRGPVTLQRALEESINVVAVKLLDRIGIRYALDVAERAGISTLVRSGEPNDAHLALALGGLTRGVTPLQLARAYATLASGGIRVEPYAVVRVETADGEVLERVEPRRERVFEPGPVYTLVNMMEGVIRQGTGTSARIGRPAAGKTGTTSDYTNVWFAGFTPQVVTVVWIGNDRQEEPMRYGNGQVVRSSVPAAIWGRFMSQALAPLPVASFRVGGRVGYEAAVRARAASRSTADRPSSRSSEAASGASNDSRPGPATSASPAAKPSASPARAVASDQRSSASGTRASAAAVTTEAKADAPRATASGSAATPVQDGAGTDTKSAAAPPVAVPAPL